MRRIIQCFVLTLCAVAADASDRTDVVSAVNRLVTAFNNGDTQAFIASCAAETSIVDEIPPHEWHGAGGCAKWVADYGLFVEHEQIADAVTTVGTPRRVVINGKDAYVVLPATCTYRQAGKSVRENVIVTVTLHSGSEGWRLTGWTWARL